MTDWRTPDQVLAVRDGEVVDGRGRRHRVKLYADGWALAGHEGLDVWQALALLNHLGAAPARKEEGR